MSGEGTEPEPGSPGAMDESPIRRASVWGLRAALVLLALALTYPIVHLVAKRPLPPPLATEADLGPVPPPEENGFVDLQAYMKMRTQTSVVPTDVRRIVANEAVPPPAEVMAAMPSLEAFLATEPARSDARAMQTALAKPRWADPCPVRIDADCRVISLVAIHDAYVAKLLVDAAKAPDGGVDAAMALVERDLALLASGRSLLFHAIAVRNLGSSFHALAFAASRAPAEARSALAAKLGALPLDAVSAERAAMTEHVLLRKVLAGEWAADAPKHSWLRWSFDPGRTAEIADACQKPLLAALRAHTPLPPPCEPPEKGLGFWLYNPTGKLILQGMQAAHEPYVKFEKRRTELLEDRKKVVAGLR